MKIRSSPALGSSIQQKLTVECPDLGRLDELCMTDHHAMQRPIELLLPESQEFDQNRELRCNVVVLPDVGLQQARIVGQMIKNARGGEAIAGKLLNEIRRHFACFNSFGRGHCFNSVLVRWPRRTPSRKQFLPKLL